jgi:SAM-dependent methyltransferase
MSHLILSDQREVWRRKPVLRYIYSDFYIRLLRFARDGRTLEIGGGSGNLKEFVPQAISTDLLPSPWLDAAVDAQQLPFADKCLDNIVCVDVLHHIESSVRFFREASRVLKPGGKIMMVEPAITPVSGWFYRRFHPEPVRMMEDPLCDPVPDSNRVPFDANQAIPTLLFGKHRTRFELAFPEFRIERNELFSLFAYPLSGGFRPWSLVPGCAVKHLLALEDRISPWLGRLLAFRMLVVLEKQGNEMHADRNPKETGNA